MWNLHYTKDNPLFAYAIALSILTSLRDKIAPTPQLDRSTSNTNDLVKFGLIRINVLINASFKMLNATWH